MDKIRYLLILVLLLLVSPLYSEESLELSIEVPDDYGVTIPSNVLKLDRFVFEYGGRLVPDDYLFIGPSEDYSEGLVFTLLYYGNRRDDYDVEITADPGLGWVMLSEGETITIPIDCSWYKSQETPAGYQVYAGEENDVYIHVPAKGPVNGDPVAEFRLDWGDKAALRPGIYKTEISLVLSAV